MNKFFATVTVLSGLFIGSFAMAECPVKEMDLDKIIDVISAETTCASAADVAESCFWGSTADVAQVAAATTVCEKDYADKLTSADKEIMTTLFNKCSTKFEKADGTLFRAMEAHCGLSVVKLFSNLYTPAEFQ